MITKEQYEQFDSAYKTWFASKGNDGKKKQMLKQMREVYKLHLWQKLKDMYKRICIKANNRRLLGFFNHKMIFKAQ